MTGGGRANTIVAEPEGLAYRPDVISREEERDLAELLDGMQLREVTMRGQTAKRTVRHFGYDYDYESWKLRPAEPLPSVLVFFI